MFISQTVQHELHIKGEGLKFVHFTNPNEKINCKKKTDFSVLKLKQF